MEKSNDNLYIKSRKGLESPRSYRPIAFLSSISKLYERVILDKFHTHSAKKIRKEQFAFRPGHLSTLQLVSLVHQISAVLNNKEHTATVFLDVEKDSYRNYINWKFPTTSKK